MVDIPLAFSSLYAPLLVTALFIMKICIPITFLVMYIGQNKEEKEEDDEDEDKAKEEEKEGGSSSDGSKSVATSLLSLRDRQAVDIRVTELKYINSQFPLMKGCVRCFFIRFAFDALIIMPAVLTLAGLELIHYATFFTSVLLLGVCEIFVFVKYVNKSWLIKRMKKRLERWINKKEKEIKLREEVRWEFERKNDQHESVEVENEVSRDLSKSNLDMVRDHDRMYEQDEYVFNPSRQQIEREDKEEVKAPIETA